MEFLPSTQDLSSPKATLIQSSLAFVVLTAIGVRFWMRRSFMAQRLPAAKAEAFTMVSKDFGDVAETRRDASRSFAGGGIYLQLPRDADGDTFLLKLKPPEGSSSGVDKETVEANIKAFAAELRSQLSALTITDAHVQRILPMLTVNPAVSALAAAGKVPMLKDNRFILQSHSSGSGTTLHALTVGYVGQLPGPDGKPGGNDEVLTVASPDLLAPSPEADPRMYELTYVLRRAEKRSLEDELTLPGVLSLPWLG